MWRYAMTIVLASGTFGSAGAQLQGEGADHPRVPFVIPAELWVQPVEPPPVEPPFPTFAFPGSYIYPYPNTGPYQNRSIFDRDPTQRPASAVSQSVMPTYVVPYSHVYIYPIPNPYQERSIFDRDPSQRPPAPPPPPPEPQPGVAYFTVNVPTGADVWIDGQKMDRPAGRAREFVALGLEGDRTYNTLVRVRWSEAGANVERTRVLTLQAGDEKSWTILGG